ncbi:MAG: hypothetical protein AAGF12_38785 [Myxococcota bacterium]
MIVKKKELSVRNGGTKDEKRRVGRRALIKWSVAAGAALGLPQWKVFEVLEGSSGKALAQEASCLETNRSVHIIGGTGGFAWFNLLWPHNDVAAAMDPSMSWHAIGEETMADSHRPLTLGPESPWADRSGTRQVTCMMAGQNETHTNRPSSNNQVAMNVDLFATCASMQAANPTLVPVIAVDDAPYRDAPGAPRVARVGRARDIVALFNSAASRAGGLLSTPAHADLFSTRYSTFLSLRAAAGSPTYRRGFDTGNDAASYLGRNLSDRLAPTDEDFLRYGVTAVSRDVNRELAALLITTAKAFSMGLTSSVVIPAFRDDPHGAFNDMGRLRGTVGTLGRSLDAFLEDLGQFEEPSCSGDTLADNTVISIHGDTPKTPLNRQNWPDGTPENSNWIYVLGAGLLKSGWFGGVDRDGTVRGWNPETGEDADVSAATTANAASAAVAYAVARGDLRKLGDFFRGTLRGVAASETI